MHPLYPGFNCILVEQNVFAKIVRDGCLLELGVLSRSCINENKLLDPYSFS